jgi:DNA-binding transcriptional MerR regulator
MLISEFSRVTGLTPDTIRFYIRKGLIKPETAAKGGSNPYQLFTSVHVEIAKIIRTSQALGFSLKDIAGTIESYMTGEMPNTEAADMVRRHLAVMEEKSRQLSRMVIYMRAKLQWLEQGRIGPGPHFPEPP